MIKNDHPIANLTEAQRDVLRLVMAGYKSKEIAHRLGIGIDAVNKRLASAKAAIGAPSRFAAARQLAAFEAAEPASQFLVSQFLAVEDAAASPDCEHQPAVEASSDDLPPPHPQAADTRRPYVADLPSARPDRRFDIGQLVATPGRVFLIALVIGALAALLLRI